MRAPIRLGLAVENVPVLRLVPLRRFCAESAGDHRIRAAECAPSVGDKLCVLSVGHLILIDPEIRQGLGFAVGENEISRRDQHLIVERAFVGAKNFPGDERADEKQRDDAADIDIERALLLLARLLDRGNGRAILGADLFRFHRHDLRLERFQSLEQLPPAGDGLRAGMQHA